MKLGFLLEDHGGAQDWLQGVLTEVFPGISVTVSGRLSEARDKLSHLLQAGFTPDIALIDLSLPDGTGIDFIRDLREQAPECLCIVVTIHDDDRHVFPALRAGARGYLLKQQPQAELARRLSGLIEDEPPLSPSVARRVLATFAPPDTSSQPDLTPREQEVLELIAKGFTLAQVGQALGITRHTTAGYVKSVYRKLEVSSRAEATREAMRMGMIDR
ncbi:response regulator [Marinobacter confluentis]|uniref:Response regulator transcription factor n=1 Tax=Marinobacter confluentis TaxID=1697557 RepID=A0A4Z1C4K9_9GAMM|nr:response regulator transcription factor [Marinobacter confluentis]TGN40200.1 response regulator transcription factor [Marinobacter confluentis]